MQPAAMRPPAGLLAGGSAGREQRMSSGLASLREGAAAIGATGRHTLAQVHFECAQ